MSSSTGTGAHRRVITTGAVMAAAATLAVAAPAAPARVGDQVTVQRNGGIDSEGFQRLTGSPAGLAPQPGGGHLAVWTRTGGGTRVLAAPLDVTGRPGTVVEVSGENLRSASLTTADTRHLLATASDADVRVRVLDAAGRPSGSPLVLDDRNDGEVGSAFNPVAGAHVVAYTRDDVVRVRLVRPDGTAPDAAGEISGATGVADAPAVAVDPATGRVLVAWISDTDDAGTERPLWVRALGPDLTPVGPPRRVSFAEPTEPLPTEFGSGTEVAVAHQPSSGRFVVVRTTRHALRRISAGEEEDFEPIDRLDARSVNAVGIAQGPVSRLAGGTATTTVSGPRAVTRTDGSIQFSWTAQMLSEDAFTRFDGRPRVESRSLSQDDDLGTPFVVSRALSAYGAEVSPGPDGDVTLLYEVDTFGLRGAMLARTLPDGNPTEPTSARVTLRTKSRLRNLRSRDGEVIRVRANRRGTVHLRLRMFREEGVASFGETVFRRVRVRANRSVRVRLRLSRGARQQFRAGGTVQLRLDAGLRGPNGDLASRTVTRYLSR